MATKVIQSQTPTTFTATANTSYVQSGTIDGICSGDIVLLTITAVKLKSGTPAWNTIFTIPEGYRPKRSGTTTVIVVEAGKTVAYLNVSSSGSISMYGMTAGSEYSGSVTYIK